MKAPLHSASPSLPLLTYALGYGNIVSALKCFISYIISTFKIERNSQVYTVSERPDLPERVESFI